MLERKLKILQDIQTMFENKDSFYHEDNNFDQERFITFFDTVVIPRIFESSFFKDLILPKIRPFRDSDAEVDPVVENLAEGYRFYLHRKLLHKTHALSNEKLTEALPYINLPEDMPDVEEVELQEMQKEGFLKELLDYGNPVDTAPNHSTFFKEFVDAMISTLQRITDEEESNLQHKNDQVEEENPITLERQPVLASKKFEFQNMLINMDKRLIENTEDGQECYIGKSPRYYYFLEFLLENKGKTMSYSDIANYLRPKLNQSHSYTPDGVRKIRNELVGRIRKIGISTTLIDQVFMTGQGYGVDTKILKGSG